MATRTFSGLRSSPMTSPQNPESGADTFGGQDPGPEDELAGPGTAGPDTLGGADPGPEDELAGPGTAGPDTLGGQDRGSEDELRPEG